MVPSRGGALQLDDLTAAISQRTRVVTISQVSYKTGAWFPHTAALAEVAHSVGAIFCLDATQALGRCPVPLTGVDYLMASTFKWLLGLHGSAITYMSPSFRERFSLAGVGWYSVRDGFSAVRAAEYELKPGAACLVAGMPNFSALYAANASLKFLLSVSDEAAHQEVNVLVRNLRIRLGALGLSLLTPGEEAFTSGIVSFEHPAGDRVAAQLEENGIVVWGGDGRVRASLHYYNNADDVDQYVTILKKILSL
jgi:selenocysteine lyase/cysteine desulfurase